MFIINLLLWLGQMLAAHDTGAGRLPQASLFTREQANTFLLAAMQAESIKDPLQRCLAYPDPPDSHWDRAAVVAYCRYRHQSPIALAQIRRYIKAGHAAELDKLLAQALHAERTDPNSLDRMASIYYTAFRHPSPALRSLLNEWKRQSPGSGFAYAASGLAYEQAAFDARGTNEIDDTPRENLEDMHTLSELANTDLQKAVSLNPRIMPAWIAMISLGGADRGRAYGESAAKRALAIEPFSYDVHSELIWLEQPNWYGSLTDMQRIAREAQKHVKRNPTLKMLIPLKDFYRIDHCHCDATVQLHAYAAVLKDLAGVHQIKGAAGTASDTNNIPMSAIYDSELLRFNSDPVNARLDRMYALTDLGFTPWAIREGNALLAQSPDNEYAVKARAVAYFAAGDLLHAKEDFRKATELAPDDTWAWSQLGDVYMGLRQWDAAWRVADVLIRHHAKYASGWLLRASIQENQPRAGLGKTADELALRFGSDPHMASYAAHLREVAKEPAKRAVIHGDVEVRRIER